MRAVVARRAGCQVKALRAVKEPQHVKVREAFDIGKAGRVIGEDFEFAFGFVFCSQPFWNVLGFFVRTSHVSDRLHRVQSDSPLLLLIRYSLVRMLSYRFCIVVPVRRLYPDHQVLVR